MNMSIAVTLELFTSRPDTSLMPMSRYTKTTTMNA